MININVIYISNKDLLYKSFWRIINKLFQLAINALQSALETV